MTKFIYITGCDGTGKSTQASSLIDRLSAEGIETKHVWLRFPFLFSIPLLIYARLRGYSWYEENGGVRHGYWDFRPSWALRTCLPWILLFDAALAAIAEIYLPLWGGKTLVCERFVLDMLADLSIACGDTQLHRRLPGSLYLRLLPRESHIFVLDLDITTIRKRREDLNKDKRLRTRLNTYRYLADDLSITTFSSNNSPYNLCELILKSAYGQNLDNLSQNSKTKAP